MKKNGFLFLLLFFYSSVYADPIISFFFRPLNDFSTINRAFKKPGKLAKYSAKAIIESAPVAGIIATYGGYIASSNYNGEISFPRKHQNPAVTIIVTPEIIPIPLFENTILQWKLVPNVSAQLCTCELRYNDDKKQYYWNIEEGSLPDDGVIPLSAILIIAKPKNIVMTLGQTTTNDTANLVLPDVYVKKGIDITRNSAYMLTISHLFKVVHTQEMKDQLKILTHTID